jgi:FKBP12-rapamycin complex-associated protein
MQQDIPEVTGILLNLAEFMEHVDRGPLPLNEKTLAERAIKCRAFAKALHYKEEEFHKGPTTDVLGALISINNKLQQPEAAVGVLEYANKNQFNEIEVKERWYEKLHDWENALKAYKLKSDKDPKDVESIVGQMRCLEVLSEWNKLYNLALVSFPDVNQENKQKMARMASTAAWGLGHWPQMEEYTKNIAADTPDSAFYQAILQV